MKRAFRLLCLIALSVAAFATPALSQRAASIDALMADSLARLGGDAVVIVARWDGRIVHQAGYGAFSPDTPVILASATKWLSGAVIASLVSDGTLALDDTLAQFFPDLEGAKRSISVRQLFAHTSGLPGQSACLSSATTTLQSCAAQTLAADLRAAPGAAFAYGGASMQVGGRVAEIASGQSWADLFAERIAAPLGLTQTTYGDTRNPRIAGGAEASARDYVTFLQMIAARGMHNGRQVLAASAVDAMLADQTGDAQVGYSPYGPFAPRFDALPPVDSIRYGVGVWREQLRAGGELGVSSSPGAFGASPWIDFDAQVVGILLVRNRLSNAMGPYLDLQRLARELAAPPTLNAPTATATGLTIDAPRPHPVRSAVTLRYHVPPSLGPTVVTLFDAQGRRVATLDRQRRAGDHAVRFDASSLAPGAYRIVVRSRGERVGRWIVVAH